MTSLHQYLHAEEQTLLKFAPITAKSPAPWQLGSLSVFQEEKRIQVSYHWTIWISESWNHHTQPEIRNATCTSATALPSPGSRPRHTHPPNKLNLPPVGQMQVLSSCTLPIQFLPSKRAGKVTSPELKGKRCHVEVCQTWWSQTKCYLLLHIHQRENPGALIFI